MIRPPLVRRLAAAGLVATTFGCTTFGPVNAREYVTSKRPPEIWVWKADSSVVQMRGPHFLSADTLVGLVEGAYTEVPISDVKQVKASRPAPLRTLGLVAGGVAAITTTAVLLKKGNATSEICVDSNCDPSDIYR